MSETFFKRFNYLLYTTAMVRYYSVTIKIYVQKIENKLLIKMLNKINASIESCGTQKKILFPRALDNVYACLQFKTIQQTFLGLQDAFKTSSRHVLNRS